MYAKFLKRFFDFTISLIAVVLLLPVLIVLTVVGAVVMKGNPFFVQNRPGMINKKTNKEKIIPLLKFRTMTNERDEYGQLLPDEKRLTAYGNFLRSTSLDELPSLLQVVTGDLSLVGPRPLLVVYLERYSQTQRRRHEVRPGLTGYAQAYGRNSLTWEEKFEKDVYYVDNISLLLDIKILFQTVAVVLKREGISSEHSVTMEEFMGTSEKSEELTELVR